MILISTSRKPSRNTRIVARILGNMIPFSMYVTRGKKTVEDLIDYSRNKGLKKVAIIHDQKGNPGEIQFIKVTKTNWDWDKSLKIKGSRFEKKKIKSQDINVKGRKKKGIEEMFLLESVEDSPLTLNTNDNKLEFTYDNELVMSLKLEVK